MDKPKILIEGEYNKSDLDDFKSNNKIWKELDIYESQLGELFEIINPNLIDGPEFKFLDDRSSPDPEVRGNYVYYPWSGLLLHTISEAEQNRLRVNRTTNLVTEEEQRKLGDFTAGVAGLSFGNGIVLSLVYAGASNTIKIADTDIFETTNLNRVRVGLPSVNKPKTDVTAQDIYEINPYADVKVYQDGLTDQNLDDFINGQNPLKIVFDVVDDLSMKVKIRFAAKKAKIPVVMLTSLEDSILVDVERYDLDPSAEIFHGLLGNVTEELLTKEMTEQDKAKYAMAIVGVNNISHRNLLSLSKIGKELVSRPHLYSTVSIVCGLAGYILKRIALGEDMPSTRKLVKFNEVLNILPAINDTPEARQELLTKLMGGPPK